MKARYLLCLLSSLVGCGASQAGATDASLAKANGEAGPGASTFAARCASCHGDRGQGRAYAPPVMGPGALPVYPRDAGGAPITTDPVQLQLQSQTRPPGSPSRNPFRNARDLQTYLTTHRPDEGTRSLPPNDLWPLVTFMLLANGNQVPAGGVSPDNADSVKL